MIESKMSLESRGSSDQLKTKRIVLSSEDIPDISSSSQLSHLEVKACSMDAGARAFLLNVIAAAEELEELTIPLAGFSDDDIKSLTEIVALNRSIETINGIEIFSLRAESEIYSVDLSDLSLQPTEGALLAELVNKNPTVIEVKLPGCSLMIKELKKGFEEGFIDLSMKPLNLPCVRFLTSLMPNGAKLDILRLSKCGIGNEGALALASTIERLCVKEVDLSFNQIEPEGCLAIVQAAAAAETENLDLRGNRLISATEELEKLLTVFKKAEKLMTMNTLALDTIRKSATTHELNLSGSCLDSGLTALVLMSIESIPKLAQIKIEGCRLNDHVKVFTEALCRCLRTCTSLKDLSLSNNGLPDEFTVSLASALPTSSLVTLDLSQNNFGKGLVVLSKALTKSNSIKRLDLRKNDLNEARAKQVHGFIDRIGSLEEVNQLRISPSPQEELSIQLDEFDYVSVATALSSRSQIKCLVLSKAQVNCAKAAFVGKLLSKNKSLEKLDLSYNSIAVEGAKALAEGLTFHQRFKELNISRNTIGDGGMILLVEALSCSIEILNVAGNEIGVGGMQELTKALNSGCTLRSIDISFNTIRNAGFDAICLALPNSRLTSLKARQVGISTSKPLGSVLRERSQLVQVDLSRNGLGSSCAHVVDALKRNTCITHLALQENRIGDTVTSLLAQCLTSNRSLVKISLRRNRIKDKGAIAIAKVLEQAVSLQSLDLASNFIGEIGGSALAKVLAKTRRLKCLDVRCNPLGKEAIKLLSLSWETNKSLDTLRLYNFTTGSDEGDSHYSGSQSSSATLPFASASSVASSYFSRYNSCQELDRRSDTCSVRSADCGEAKHDSTRRMTTYSSSYSSSSVSTKSLERSSLRKVVAISKGRRLASVKAPTSRYSTLWRRRKLKEESKFDF